VARQALRLLFSYLVETGVLKPAKLEHVEKAYDWLLDPYLLHLEKECGFLPVTIGRARVLVGVPLGIGPSPTSSLLAVMDSAANMSTASVGASHRPSNRKILIEGPPGGGKSDLVSQVADELP